MLFVETENRNQVKLLITPFVKFLIVLRIESGFDMKWQPFCIPFYVVEYVVAKNLVRMSRILQLAERCWN